MVKIEPAGHRILVKCNPPEKRTAGGLYIPDTAQDKHQDVGIVVAIGPTAFSGGLGGIDAWGINEGDEVIFMKHGGKTVDFPGYDEDKMGFMKVINDEDIVGIIRREDA